MKVSCETNKLYRSNKPLQYILRCNENILKEMFRESELKNLSGKEFQLLIKAQLLVKTYQDPTDIIYYDKNKTAYRVRKDGKDYIGYRIRGEGDGTVLLDKADIKFYRFDFLAFSRLVNNVNGLTGKYSQITERLHFVGKKDNNDVSIGFFIGLFPSDRIAEQELMALPTRLKQYSQFFVACPCFELDEGLNSQLVDKGVFCRSFDMMFDKNWIIQFNSLMRLLSPSSKPLSISLPVIFSENQNSIVIIGDQKIALTESEYILFLRLVIGVCQNAEGWVKIDDLGSMIDEIQVRKAIGRLRDTLQPYLKQVGTDKKKFIQTGKGCYRISIQSDLISYNKQQLIKVYMADGRIMELLYRLP